MKKIICVFVLLLLLCGCGGKTVGVKVITKGITAKANIYYYGKEYECNLKAAENGEVSFLITKPKNLKDFTIIFKDGEVFAKYKGLNYTPSLSSLDYGGVLQEIYGVITYLQNNDYAVIKKSEEYYIKGKTKKNNFCLFVTEAGLPLNIVYEKDNFYIVFSEVTL
jgi:hypothetical protein